MHDNTSFGQWLRQRRKAYDFTQEDLAVRVGCAFETIRKLEAGTRRPSRQMVELLASTLKVPPEEWPSLVSFARVSMSESSATYSVAGYAADAGAAPGQGGADSQQGRPRSNLPAPTTSFIGRTQELAQVSELLRRADVRLVTLLGPPGIGKTRHSLQVAASMSESFADGCFLVPLSPISNPKMVVPAITRVLQVKELTNQDTFDTLLNYLRDKQVLLVLDNFEHVMPAAHRVGELCSACPGLKLLVSSRVALQIYGEHQFQLGPLALPDSRRPVPFEALAEYEAIQLFVQRAQAVNQDFSLTAENAGLVSEICRQLDGLPLAIELAAARSKLLSPQGILTRLSSRLKLLSSGPSDLPDRHHSLSAAVSWSYDLLNAGEKVLFRRLSVFVPGGSVEAVEAVCSLPEEPVQDALECLTSLVDKSLVHVDSRRSSDPRSWMLWTIREYAAERLQEAGEAEAVRGQHALYYLNIAESAEPHLVSADRSHWLALLDLEYENLRAALGWSLDLGGNRHVGLRIAGALQWYWYFRGYWSEGRIWLDKSLRAAGALRRTPAGAKALYSAGRLALLQDDYANLRPLLEEAAAVCNEVGDRDGLAYALVNLGLALVYRNRDPNGRALIAEGVALYRDLHNEWGLAFALDLLADAHRLLHDPEQARTVRDESLQLYRKLNDPWGIANLLNSLGSSALWSGDYEEAELLCQEAADLARQTGDTWLQAHATRGLGDAALCQGHYERAQVFYEQCLALYKQLGDRLRVAASLRHLGHVAREQGDRTRAGDLYREGLDIFQQIGFEQGVIWCLAALAGTVQMDQPYEAARLLAAAEKAISELGLVMMPGDLMVYNHNLASVREQLAEHLTASALEEGQMLSIHDAIELVSARV